MKKPNRYFYQLSILFLLPFLISCQSLQPFYIDVLVPGKKELPKDIKSFTIVTQAIDSKFDSINSDSLQNAFYKKHFNVDTVLYDIELVDSSLTVLGDLLYDSGRYGFVIPEERIIEPKPSSFLTGELSWEQVSKLCTTYNTDAVLSLDYLKTRVITDLFTYEFPTEEFEFTAEGYKAEIYILYQALYRIYEPNEKKILYRNLDVDTLYWSEVDPTIKGLFKKFIPVKDALLETSYAASISLTEQIANLWSSEQRVYYREKNEHFVAAEERIKYDDWVGAINEWDKVAKSNKSKSLRSKAYFNMALGYEILGDFNSALAVALKSYNLKYSSIAADYMVRLKERRDNLKPIKD